MLDVHERQLLVLLLVVEPDLDDRRRLRPRLLIALVGDGVHRRVDVAAVATHLGDRRS